MTAIFRPGGGDTYGVQLDCVKQFRDAVIGWYAKALGGSVRNASVHITDCNKLRAFAGLVDTGMRAADVPHSNNCYVQHGASSSEWSIFV